MKGIVCSFFLFISGTAFSQTADFILFQKNHRTIGSYHSGDNISFTSVSGNYLEAHIDKIKNDSLFLTQFIARAIPTTMGFYMYDTVGSYRYQYHYKDIKAIGRSKGGFNMSGSAASLMGGGALLTVASGIVYLADRQKFSPELLLGAAGLGGVGFLIAKLSGKGMNIGKKYSIVYIGVSNNKKP